MTQHSFNIKRILAGIALYLLFLEILARAGGFLFLRYQDYVNDQSVRKGGEFRIMCLGESTTASLREDAYTRQLEGILNAQSRGTKFSVINKGVPGITTNGIAARLNGFIDAYKPDMVVAMIGINDAQGQLDEHIAPSNEPWWGKIHVVKLAQIILKHIPKPMAARGKEIQHDEAPTDFIAIVKQRAMSANTAEGYAQGAGFLRAANDVDGEKEFIDKALLLDPNNIQATLFLADYYKRSGRFKEAAPMYERVIKLAQGHMEYIDAASDNLGQVYELLGEDKKAEIIYAQILSLVPNHPKIWASLAGVYYIRRDYDKAILLHERQLMVNPKYSICYGILSSLYHKTGQEQKALDVLLAGMRALPDDPSIVRDLGYFLLQNGQYQKGLEMLFKAIQMDPREMKNIRLYADNPLLAGYDAVTKELILKKWHSLPGVKNFTWGEDTARNYRKIYAMLKERKIPLIVVQYPNRSIDPLKDILPADEGIVFVENKQNFLQALREGSYEDFFVDRFAGDFGHFTPKGNQLIAENIAQAIESHPAVK